MMLASPNEVAHCANGTDALALRVEMGLTFASMYDKIVYRHGRTGHLQVLLLQKQKCASLESVLSGTPFSKC